MRDNLTKHKNGIIFSRKFFGFYLTLTYFSFLYIIKIKFNNIIIVTTSFYIQFDISLNYFV